MQNAEVDRALREVVVATAALQAPPLAACGNWYARVRWRIASFPPIHIGGPPRLYELIRRRCADLRPTLEPVGVRLITAVVTSAIALGEGVAGRRFVAIRPA